MRVGSARAWAALVVGMVVAALVGCTSNAKTARPGAKRQPLELAAGAPSRARLPIPLSVGPLAVGTYTTTVFSPRLTLTLDEEWRLRSESVSSVNLRRADQEDLFFLFEPEASVLDPPAYSDAEPDSEVPKRAQPMPTDYIEYLRGVPYLDVGAPQLVPVSGATGRAVDYVVTRVPDLPGNCLGQRGACFVPFASPNPALLLPGATVHVVEVDVGTHSLIIMATAASREGLAAMLAIIATVQFG